MPNTPAQRGQFGPLLAPNLFRVFIEKGKERPLEHPAWINIIDMPWNPVTDQHMSGMPTMPEMPETEQFPTFRPQMGGTKSYEARPFGMAFEVSWPMWRDELYGVMDEMASELARSGRHRKEVQAHLPLNRAFDTTYQGFSDDPTSLLSTSHTGVEGRTWSNRPAADIGFSITYLQGAIQRFEEMEDDNGMPRLMTPVLAVMAPQNKWAAREILGSSSVPYKSDNQINSLIQDDISWLISHYLTTKTYHFLMAAKGEHDINLMVREDVIFDSFDDPRTKNAVFSAYQRMDDGKYGSARGIDGSKL